MPIVIENRHARYVIGADARNLHFIECASSVDHLAREPESRCACVVKGGRRFDATAAALAGDRLSLRFGRAQTTATVRVHRAERWFAFEVLAVDGDGIEEFAFLNVPLTLEAAPGQAFAAGALALNLLTNVEELPGPQRHLRAACYRRHGFRGARAGVVAAPFADLREVCKDLVRAADGVPHSPYGGPFAMDSDAPYGSYLLGTPTETTVDAWIDLCRALGFTQIDFLDCLNYGDYEPFPHLYPNGRASVRAVTERLHAAGILAGLHAMSFSISKDCAWVRPVPDPRLARERTYTLAADLAADAGTVPLLEPLADLPQYIGYYVRRSMTLQIDDELIEYRQVRDAAPFAVLECTRGACGTVPAPHGGGTPVHHLKECWGCFLPDGDSTLFDDVAGRVAAVINECGFDFTYLDGLDGAHVFGGEAERWHYGAKFAFAVWRGLARPVMMEMATFHHHLWYVRSRLQAWDHAVRGHRRFIDLHCRSNDGARRLFMPLHLGWLRLAAGRGPEHEPTFPEDVEYLWCKALGTDASCALQALTPEMRLAEPWLQRLMPIVRNYETLRREKHVPESVKRRLREPGAEFTLLRTPHGEWQFLPARNARHKVEAVDGVSNMWELCNPFASQPPALRIEALMGCGPYDAPDNIVLAEFADADEFSDRSESDVILNSGKRYAYPAAAPGLSAAVRPCTTLVKAAPVSGCWTAHNAGSAERILSSAPDDEYSLLDHGECAYRLRPAAWVRLGKRFARPLDLSRHRGLGVWVHGDGQGELINLRLLTRGAVDAELDHYLRVDFRGWRYVEFVEPEAERFAECSWPYGRSVYKVYREKPAWENALGLSLWYNDVPVGRTVTCHLSPVKALPLVVQRLSRPALSVGGATVTFPVELESGQYLEYRGAGDCTLYSARGERLREVVPDGTIPTLASGRNRIAFACTGSASRLRANVTLMLRGDTPLSDEILTGFIP